MLKVEGLESLVEDFFLSFLNFSPQAFTFVFSRVIMILSNKRLAMHRIDKM